MELKKFTTMTTTKESGIKMNTYWEEVNKNTYCLFVEGEAYPFCTMLGDCDSWVIASDYGEGFQEEVYGDLEDAKIIAKMNMIEIVVGSQSH